MIRKAWDCFDREHGFPGLSLMQRLLGRDPQGARHTAKQATWPGCAGARTCSFASAGTGDIEFAANSGAFGFVQSLFFLRCGRGFSFGRFVSLGPIKVRFVSGMCPASEVRSTRSAPRPFRKGGRTRMNESPVNPGPFPRFAAGGVAGRWVLLYSPLGESSTTNMSKAPALSTKNTQSEAVSQLVRCL